MTKRASEDLVIYSQRSTNVQRKSKNVIVSTKSEILMFGGPLLVFK